MSDHYAVLGVDRRANADEIKKAYRRLTLEYHPDRHPEDPDAQERYRLINAAYDVLSDSSKRARYDTQARLSQGIDLTKKFDPVSARDLLGNVFGDVFRSKRRARRKGRDLRYTLTVDFAEAILGSSHDIEFEALGPCEPCEGSGTRPGGEAPQTCEVCSGKGEVKGEGLFAPWTRCGRCDGTGLLQADACETCRGSGRRRAKRAFSVKLPAGVDTGTQKVLEGQGEPGRFGADAGDLRVTVSVRPHPHLQRKGDEIRAEAFVSVTEAALGHRIPVPTVDGIVMVDLPKGVRGGTKLRLRGKGVPKSDGRGRGDQLVSISVETPIGVDATLQSTLEELERLSSSEAVMPRRHAQRESLGPADDDS